MTPRARTPLPAPNPGITFAMQRAEQKGRVVRAGAGKRCHVTSKSSLTNTCRHPLWDSRLQVAGTRADQTHPLPPGAGVQKHSPHSEKEQAG